MQKYRWSLYKTLEFLNSRRPDLEVRAAFVSQLADFEQKLISQDRGPQTANWNEVADTKISLDKDLFYPDEELILRNTYLNAHLGDNKSFDKSKQEEPQPAKPSFSHKNEVVNEEISQGKIKWIDDNKNKKDVLRTNHSDDDLILKENVDVIKCHKTKQFSKSIMKQNKSTNNVSKQNK